MLEPTLIWLSSKLITVKADAPASPIKEYIIWPELVTVVAPVPNEYWKGEFGISVQVGVAERVGLNSSVIK
jgi:hypothetical protein